jgi:hypothetical protein
VPPQSLADLQRQDLLQLPAGRKPPHSQRPRQKIICSLGDLSPRPKEQWLELARKLESALTGQQDRFASTRPEAELETLVTKVKAGPRRPRAQQDQPALAASVEPGEEKIAVLTGAVRSEHSREAGPVHVGYQFWQRLRIDAILEEAGLSERARQLSCAMTLHRLIHPASELAMPDWIRSTALPDILGIDFQGLAEDALYRNLDKLHPRREPIEAALAERERNLFDLDQTVFLYDVTSTYFEGRALANPKARRGYSRDHRGDCKQVLVGLAVNRDGFPLAHEVMAGNRHDSTTLEEMLAALDRRVGLREGQTVVVAAPYSERHEWLEEFQDAAEFEEVWRGPSPRNPFQKKSTIQVKLRQAVGETHVLCVSSERKEKDRAIRQAHEKRLVADLAKLEKRVAKGQGKGTKPEEVQQSIGRLRERYSRVARYYRMEYDAQAKTFHYSLDEAKRAPAEKLDGSYLLKTDREDLSADEAGRIYILLTRAEAAFRTLKSPLGQRPVFHHKEGRVEAHIFLCVLAYHLPISIEKTLLNQGVHTSWATVRETLKTHQVNTIVLPTDGGLVLRIRKGTTPQPAHRELYAKLGIEPEVIRPRKNWTRDEVSK